MKWDPILFRGQIQSSHMIVEFVIGVVITFVIVVVGSYVGAKMALNTFFGRDFVPSNPDQLVSSKSESEE